MYYILLYDVVDDYIRKRAPYRQKHLELCTEAVNKGHLMLGGAFDDPVDGAAIVFETENSKVVEDFVNNDPYVQNGLVTDWKIRKWTLVIGTALEE
jgi:uncharacterized protein YciI